MQVSETTRTHDVNNKPSRVIRSIKLYVYAGRLTKLLKLLLCVRLAVPAILVCNHFDHFMDCTYPKTRWIVLIDGLTVAIIWHYWEQRLVNSANWKFPKREWLISSEILSIQRLWTPPFNQTITTAQTKPANWLLLIPDIVLEKVKIAALREKFQTSSATCLFAISSLFLLKRGRQSPEIK